MDRSKEELLGSIQRLASQRRQLASDLKGQRDDLSEIDAELPAKKELAELAAKTAKAGNQLSEQRKNSEEYQNQKTAVLEARAALETIDESLSETLILYMIKTKTKSVHAYVSDDATINREIVTVAKIGPKVPANQSLFPEDN